MLREREDKLEMKLSLTSYLRECFDRFRVDSKYMSQSLHNSILTVFMDFIKAMKTPDSDEIKVESYKALNCYA